MSSLFTEISEDMAKKEAPFAVEAQDAAQQEGNSEASFNAIRSSYLEALRSRALELQSDGNFDLNEADVRFSTALNLSRVRNALVAIVGAGGLGNWQWRILASMGFRRIAIYDDDNVGIENVGPQAHSIFDLDMPKVQAVENAALAYRGIKILARNCRVMSYSEICADLGEDPDIVIGCTDSADFRNNFIDRLISSISEYGGNTHLPDLFIDYRMSLGDWVAYIIPAKAMKSYSGKSSFCVWYKHAAVFPASEAVQEPCTERAIAYTGANVASFTGALLHWFYSGGRQKFHDQEYMRSFAEGNAVMPGRKVSFSSRDFEFITDTVKEKKLEAKLAKLRAEANAAWDFMRKGYNISAYFQYYDSGDALPEDYHDRYHGKLIVALKEKNVLLCGFNQQFCLRTDRYGTINFHILGQRDISLMQPYVVYDCSQHVRIKRALLQLLSSEPGSIFKIGYSENYIRVQKEYIEQLFDCPVDPYDYTRILWHDLDTYNRFSHVTGGTYAEIGAIFDKFSREFDEERRAHESVDIQDGDNDDASENSRLERGDLMIGMVVTIGGDDEPLTVVEISGGYFKVQNVNGEETNYSMRRFPDVCLVSE